MVHAHRLLFSRSKINFHDKFLAQTRGHKSDINEIKAVTCLHVRPIFMTTGQTVKKRLKSSWRQQQSTTITPG